VTLKRGDRLHVHGPNGIGKTTFLELVANGEAAGVSTAPGVKIGYYRQDFHNFDFNSTVMECLQEACNGRLSEQELYSQAAKFMLRVRWGAAAVIPEHAFCPSKSAFGFCGLRGSAIYPACPARHTIVDLVPGVAWSWVRPRI